jgi:hypothetical protein
MIIRLLVPSLVLAGTAFAAAGSRFEISFPASAHGQPITSRVYVFLSRKDSPEPRSQAAAWQTSETPFFGMDVEQWKSGQAVAIDGTRPAIRSRA